MPMPKCALPKDEIIELYFDKLLSFGQIALIYGCSGATIGNRFEEWGIRPRTISESMRGRKHDWGQKIGETLKGHVVSPETRNKISKRRMGACPWNKGKRKATHMELRNTGNCGEKHWNWKGGISSNAIRIRQSSEYKAWRDAVYIRDNYMCQFCEKRGGTLVAHHIIAFGTILDLPEELKNELLFDPNNGYTLCEECHKEIHYAN